MNTTPIEYADACIAVTEAWNEYNLLLDRAHTRAEYDAALQKAYDAERTAHEWYMRWQTVGGTSDIKSIVEAELFLECVETCLVDPAHIRTAEFSIADAVQQELQPKRLSVMDDSRLERRVTILAILANESVTKAEAHEYFLQLAEIDQALQFNPSDTTNDYIGARWDKFDEIEF
jgi:hypothetical protein